MYRNGIQTHLSNGLSLLADKTNIQHDQSSPIYKEMTLLSESSYFSESKTQDITI